MLIDQETKKNTYKQQKNGKKKTRKKKTVENW